VVRGWGRGTNVRGAYRGGIYRSTFCRGSSKLHTRCLRQNTSGWWRGVCQEMAGHVSTCEPVGPSVLLGDHRAARGRERERVMSGASQVRQVHYDSSLTSSSSSSSLSSSGLIRDITMTAKTMLEQNNACGKLDCADVRAAETLALFKNCRFRFICWFLWCVLYYTTGANVSFI